LANFEISSYEIRDTRYRDTRYEIGQFIKQYNS
jgi:hypothetical protein